MTTRHETQDAAAGFAAVLPASRPEAMAFCYGYLDQTVKRFVDGAFTLADLRDNRELLEVALDLHLQREDRTC